MSIDQFTPRVLTEAVNKIVEPKALVLQRTFTRTELAPEDKIDYEIKTSTQKLMQFVQRGQPALFIQGDGVEIKTITMPSLREATTIPAAAVLAATQGGPVHGGASPMARFEMEVAKRQAKFVARATRRKNWMACKALQGGFTVSQSNVKVTVDFGVAAAHKPVLTGTQKWDSGAAELDIPGQIQDWVDLIESDSGFSVTTGYLGASAAKQFLANKKITDQLNTKNLNVGQLVLNFNTAFLGEYGGIMWFRHNETYVDDLNVKQKMIPANACVLVADDAPFTIYYGAVVDLQAGLNPVQYFSKQWEVQDPSGRILLVETNPFPVPKDPDAVVFATVL